MCQRDTNVTIVAPMAYSSVVGAHSRPPMPSVFKIGVFGVQCSQQKPIRILTVYSKTWTKYQLERVASRQILNTSNISFKNACNPK